LREEENGGTYSPSSVSAARSAGGLDPDQAELVHQLQARDREVRQHEQSHAAILGPYAVGTPSYAYQIGPDGRPYAVGGSQEVDLSRTGDAGTDAIKSARIRAAAGGVQNPSAADGAVMSQAARIQFRATA
jgi:hypothetical protein